MGALFTRHATRRFRGCLTAALALLPAPLLAAEDVTVRPLAEIVVALPLSTPAEVVAANRTELAAEVTGTVAAVRADVGASVAAGDVLVELDRRDYRLALRRAEANLASRVAEIERARTQLERARRLAEKQYASSDEVLTLETNLAVLERAADIDRVDVDAARLNLARTRIAAPFDGVVERRNATVGAYVSAGAPVMTLTQSSGPELDAQVHPELLESLRDTDDILYRDGRGDHPVVIERIAGVIDPDSRRSTVRLSFTGAGANIGSSGTLTWIDGAGRIPADLVERRNGSLGVFVLNGDTTARFHTLPGAQEGRPAAHDLAPSTLIVIDGRVRLADGDTVHVTER